MMERSREGGSGFGSLGSWQCWRQFFLLDRLLLFERCVFFLFAGGEGRGGIDRYMLLKSVDSSEYRRSVGKKEEKEVGGVKKAASSRFSTRRVE